MEKAGFIQVEHVGMSGVTTSRFTVGALFRARNPPEHFGAIARRAAALHEKLQNL
jgi:hypothetical protein